MKTHYDVFWASFHWLALDSRFIVFLITDIQTLTKEGYQNFLRKWQERWDKHIWRRESLLRSINGNMSFYCNKFLKTETSIAIFRHILYIWKGGDGALLSELWTIVSSPSDDLSSWAGSGKREEWGPGTSPWLHSRKPILAVSCSSPSGSTEPHSWLLSQELWIKHFTES